MSKSLLLQVLNITTLLPLHPPKINPLPPFPSLHPGKEQHRLSKHNPSFPTDPRMLKHLMIKHRNIQRRKNSNKPRHHSPKQELITPNILYPLRKQPPTLWLHHKETPSHIHHFPCQEKREPSKADKSGTAGAEHSVAGRGIGVVAAIAEVAITEAEEHEGEGTKAESCHPEAVDEHVEEDFGREDTD